MSFACHTFATFTALYSLIRRYAFRLGWLAAPLAQTLSGVGVFVLVLVLFVVLAGDSSPGWRD